MEKTFIAQAYDAGDPGMRANGFRGQGPWGHTFAGPQSQADSPFQEAYDQPFPRMLNTRGVKMSNDF